MLLKNTHKFSILVKSGLGLVGLVIMLGLLGIGLNEVDASTLPNRPSINPASPNSPMSTTLTTSDYQTLLFEANVGQGISTTAPYVARGLNGVLLFHPTELEMRLAITDAWEIGVSPLATITLQFVGADPTVMPRGLAPLGGSVNYYMGDDERAWLSKVPAFRELQIDDLYPGIDARVTGSADTLKWMFVITPTASPAQLRWQYPDADSVMLDPATGDLRISFADGAGMLIDKAPVVWQEMDQQALPISATYAIGADGSIGLELGQYNPDLPLMVDPTLIYSTFWGGSQSDSATDIALDAANNACITGDTTSFAPGGFNDVYVSCFDANGQWLYTTIVGGNSYEGGAELTFAPSGQLYVTGPTWSTNFPFINGATAQGNGDAFALRLNGGAMIGSAGFGGSQLDQGFGIAVDSAGDVYIVGGTASSDFVQITAGTALYAANQGGRDAFIVKTDAALTLAPLYGSYLGGTADDCDFYKGCEVAVDATTGVYLTGNTDSADYPYLNAIQPFNGGGTPGWGGDAFVTKLEWTGTTLNHIYSTPLGGTGYEESYGIAVDSMNNAIVVGTTSSNNFPTTAFALQPTFGGGVRDAFVSKLGWDGSTLSLLYSTYLGGTGTEQANDVAINPINDAIYLAGYTNSPNYPTANALYPTLAGSYDAFITALHSNGAMFVFSTYMGGASSDGANGIAVNANCDAYVTGGTSSGGFPTQMPWNPTYQGNGDAFVTRLGFTCPIGITPNVNDLTLEFGQMFTEVLTVTIPAQPPCVLDVYFLADTTGSMGGIINTVRNNASTILSNITAQLPDCDIAYGVGNYKDFPFDAYAFQHQQSLTTNAASAQTAISAWTAGGGSDTPEAQLYGLYKLGQDFSGSIGWRSTSTQRMVVWFGDAPAHDPICQSIHGDASIPFDITLANTAGILNGNNIQVLAIDTNNLNGTATGNNYMGCTGNGSPVPSNSAQLLAAMTGGAYQSGVNPTNVVATIVSQVTALASAPILNVSLVPSGGLPPFVTVVPAGGYGPLDPTISHTLPFTVTFTGPPCTDVAQVFTGTLDVMVDGVIVASKVATITVPPCVCFAPPLDMVAWWTLDELAAPWAYDIAGPHNGLHVLGPVPTPGMVDGGLDFDGVNDHVRVANAPAINFGGTLGGLDRGDFSIDAWIRPDNFNNKEASIVTKWDGIRGYYFFVLDGRLSLVMADGTGASYYAISTAPLIPTGVWTHVAVTVDRDDPNGITFYVDGLPIGTEDPTARFGSLVNAYVLTIGGTGIPWAYTTWRHFDGIIDEVEIFNRELDPSEIWGIFHAQGAGKCKPEPQPDLIIRKIALGDFIAGSTGTYQITVHNTGAAAAAGPIVVQDTLPAGFMAPIVAGGTGWMCTVTGMTVSCTHPGPVPVGGMLPPIIIHAVIADDIGDVADNCADVENPNDLDPTNNTSCIETPILQPSPTQDFPRSDLGDAPDSDNNSGVGMTTYGGGTVANFPTVWNATIPGPLHGTTKADAWLGVDSTKEANADLMPDMDSLTNIAPTSNAANRDKADDGLNLKTARLPRCRLTRFEYDASVIGGTSARYLNVWIDFNRDGDFADTLTCIPKGSVVPVTMPEWAVANYPVTLSNGYHTGLLTPLFRADRGSSWLALIRGNWMRISLATQPAPAPGDGRGPASGYTFGETEDYLLRLKLKPVIVKPSLPVGLVVENTLGFSDTLDIPAQAVTRETTLAYFPVTAPLTDSQTLQPLGVRFDLDAFVNDVGVPDLTFERSLTMTVHYGSGVHAGTGMFPKASSMASPLSSPKLYVRDGAAWVESTCAPITDMADEDKMIVPICQSGEFAIFITQAHQVFLPLVVRKQ